MVKAYASGLHSATHKPLPEAHTQCVSPPRKRPECEMQRRSCVSTSHSHPLLWGLCPAWKQWLPTTTLDLVQLYSE